MWDTWMAQLILASYLWGVIFHYSEMILLLIYLVLQFMWRKGFLLHGIFCRFLYFWLALLHSLSHYSFVYQLPCLSLCTDFYSVSSNIDEVLSINLSANVFVFGDFPTRIPDCDTLIAAVLDLFISSELVFVLQWLSLHWKILIILLYQFPLTFHQILNGMTWFTA